MRRLTMLVAGLVVGAFVATSHGAEATAKKKVLFVDSYHEGYAWSDAEIEGAKNTIGDKCEFKVTHMDTKRNNTEEFKKQAGEKVKQLIDEWKPDVVITSDDNAAAYVIVPFYMNSKLPFVFCGINWDASCYGFPCTNVTGMLEVSQVAPLLENLQKYSKGKRIGFLDKDNETERKEAEFIPKLFKIKFDEMVFVNTFDEWKKAYKEMQDKVDMLYLPNNSAIQGWNDAEAKAFILENAKIPSGCTHDFVAPFTLLSYARSGQEQGEFAAGAALKILAGTKPGDIPVAINKRGQIFINLPLAKKLNITFPMEMMKGAKFIKE